MSILKKFSAKEATPDETGQMHLNEDGLEKDLDKNIQIITKVFQDDGTLITRRFENQKHGNVKCCAFFFDGMVDNKIIDEYIISPIMLSGCLTKSEDTAEDIASKVIASNDVKKSENLEEITQNLLRGDTVLFADGCACALIISTKGWMMRSIAEPEAEKALRGPREGYTEAILTNLSMLRRKISTPDLKFKFRTFGTRSNTKACVCYLDSLVDKKLLEELNRRLDKIEIDGVLDINYIVEQIKDGALSPFKTIGASERPDVTASKLLEGRVAVFLDGTPMVMTAPFLFIENFQAADDYYLNFFFASVGRFLRILGFFLSVSIPAVYLAFTCFHREMIPTNLALSIMQAHEGIPFPTIVECLLMLIVFEIIRETGIRTPSSIGQALSIVGALVVGQSAVTAKLISAPMVIVVAITAITGLINPKIKGATILLRYSLLFASSVLGLYGYGFVMVAVLIHLFSLQSFGVIYTSQLTSYQLREVKDTVFRAPWKYMTTRPVFEQRDVVRKK